MVNENPFDEPSEVSIENGSVKLSGPGTVDISLTPEAALETSDRLFGQAMKARSKKLQNRIGCVSRKSLRGGMSGSPSKN